MIDYSDMARYKLLEPLWGEWYFVRKLGEGAFGKVFEIQREDMGRRYSAALKVITIPQSDAEWKSVMTDGMDPQSVTNYFYGLVNEVAGEIDVMSRFKGNSNIVSYEDHKVIMHQDGRGWDILVRMELLTPFMDIMLQKFSMDYNSVIKLGTDMCRALEVCHSQNVIHRDIKPENIFVSPMGDFKLGDFGIARTVEKTMGALSKKGTYSYMAPEVYRGEAYGFSADIYSLGIVLYRLLNRNRTPFLPLDREAITHGDREMALSRRINGEMLPMPADAQNILGGVVLKACAFRPQDRYRSAKEFRLALEKAAAQFGGSGSLPYAPDGTVNATLPIDSTFVLTNDFNPTVYGPPTVPVGGMPTVPVGGSPTVPVGGGPTVPVGGWPPTVPIEPRPADDVSDQKRKVILAVLIAAAAIITVIAVACAVIYYGSSRKPQSSSGRSSERSSGGSTAYRDDTSDSNTAVYEPDVQTAAGDTGAGSAENVTVSYGAGSTDEVSNDDTGSGTDTDSGSASSGGFGGGTTAIGSGSAAGYGSGSTMIYMSSGVMRIDGHLFGHSDTEVLAILSSGLTSEGEIMEWVYGDMLMDARWVFYNGNEYGLFYYNSRLVAVTYGNGEQYISDGLYSSLTSLLGEPGNSWYDGDVLVGLRWYGLGLGGTYGDYVCFDNLYDGVSHITQMYVSSDFSRYRVFSGNEPY